MKHLSFLFLLGVMASCATIKNSPQYELRDDVYEFRQHGKPYSKVFVDVQEDTVQVLPVNKVGQLTSLPEKGKDEFFLKRSFDVDVVTILFKYRPAKANLPRQLNTNFNGNIFLGYRTDRFQLHFKETPAGLQKKLIHRGFSVGAFGGLGATAINPWTTNNQTTDEYDGVVLIRGLSAMVAINNLTVGFGIGWDYLTDRDKSIWIYQNEPWLGLTLGLNLN